MAPGQVTSVAVLVQLRIEIVEHFLLGTITALKMPKRVRGKSLEQVSPEQGKTIWTFIYLALLLMNMNSEKGLQIRSET